MKMRLPVCFTSALLSGLTYVVFAVLAYLKNPQPISPLNNWLSDLGNQLNNPQGAIFYNIGVISCAVFLAIWFSAGLSEWRLKDHLIQRRLLFVAQLGGVMTAFALMMSALYPINHLKQHAFWSDTNFILFGISIAFSVAALRYHSHLPRVLLVIGVAVAILPTLVLVFNHLFWMEWIAVAGIITYIVSIGTAAYIFHNRLASYDLTPLNPRV
jgi:hypothetical protein